MGILGAHTAKGPNKSNCMNNTSQIPDENKQKSCEPKKSKIILSSTKLVVFWNLQRVKQFRRDHVSF